MLNIDRRVLAALKISLETRGYAPTIRELVADLGFTSPNSVTRPLERLEERGFIQRRRGKARALTILRLPDLTDDFGP